MNWLCDGEPKNGKDYPNCSGPHEPYENTGPDCLICGLPQEAMQPRGIRPPGTRPNWLIRAIATGFIAVIAVGVIQIFKTPPNVVIDKDPSPNGLVSANAKNPQNYELISQGEKVLLDDPTSLKQAGASAFSQQDWQEAIEQYERAVTGDRNDPEGKIYLNNARARKAGNPLTIAAVVPIALSPHSAKEILRGVADYQEEFYQSRPSSGRYLEVVVVNAGNDTLQASSLAQVLINSPNVLGVLGYGIDPGSQQALRNYESDGLAALSPLTTSVKDDSTTAGQFLLQTISIDDKANKLLVKYLQAVGQTLTEYASQKLSSPSVVLFYNSDSIYSLQLKQELIDALPQVNGKVVKEIDITAAGFNTDTELANAKQNGANAAFLVLSKNKIPQAVAIARANANSRDSLTLMGGDELYDIYLLKQGGDSIEGMVLAVPWSFKPGNPFAQKGIKIWKGRISWRTAAARDTTKALVEAISQTPNPTRKTVANSLNQGITLSGTTTDFKLFHKVPLVKAVPGYEAGLDYQFDAIN